MEDKKQLDEALKKVHSLMNFKPGMTRTENNDLLKEGKLDEQGALGPSTAYSNKVTPSNSKTPSSRVAKRKDRKAEFQLDKESGMPKKDARQKKREQRKSDNNTDPSTKEYKNIDRFVRRVHRNAQDLDQDYKKLANSTHNGENALEAAKKLYKSKYNEDLPLWRDYLKAPETNTQPVKPAYVSKFPPCKGGMNKPGCKSNAVAQVQSLVGGLDNKIKIDGMFGKNTKAAIEKVAPEFADGFTDADVAKIKAKINAPRERAKAAAVKSSDDRMNSRIDTGNQKVSNRATADADKALASRPNPLEVKEDGGATNMAIGFMNESISQKERVRINKEIRRNKKLGLS